MNLFTLICKWVFCCRDYEQLDNIDEPFLSRTTHHFNSVPAVVNANRNLKYAYPPTNHNVPAIKKSQPSLNKNRNISSPVTFPVRNYNDPPHSTNPKPVPISRLTSNVPEITIPKPQPSLDKNLNDSCTIPVLVRNCNDPPHSAINPKPAYVPINHVTSKLPAIPKPQQKTIYVPINRLSNNASIPQHQPIAASSSRPSPPKPPKKNRRGRRKYVFDDDIPRHQPIAASSSPPFPPKPPKKNNASTYKIPKHIEDMFKNDILPPVLNKPLSQSTYKEYFATLLYAEDFYIEKWYDFLMKDVTLELEDNRIRKEDDKRNNKNYFQFEIDPTPEERPFLLSRDFVFAQPLDSKDKLFEGVIDRAVRRNIVSAEFGDDFRSQHKPTRKYNVSFSFNRVCLKRAHQAIENTSDSLFKDFIFPDDSTSRKKISATPLLLFPCKFRLDQGQRSAVAAILNLKSAPPYLIEDTKASSGFRCTDSLDFGSRLVVLESIVQIYKTRNPSWRILICAPSNRTLDNLVTSLKNEIPESLMFRANAAFRGKNDVPEDLLPSCRYEEDKDCFTCPPIDELQKFQVIFTTFMSSFQLRVGGIMPGHFSHIFLVDASCTTEPRAIVPLFNLANTNTAVVVTGKDGQQSNWVRSDTARRKGLKISYFERLRKRGLYNGDDSEFVKIL